MRPHFTLAGLLFVVTFAALMLAIVVPAERYSRRTRTDADSVASVAVSADGSTFGALMGDGKVLIWDKDGIPKGSLQTQESFGADLALSFDGKLASVSPGSSDVGRASYLQVWEIATQNLWYSLPMSVNAVVFSPTEDRLAVVHDRFADSTTVKAAVRSDRPPMIKQRGAAPAHEICLVDGRNSPRRIGEGRITAFSPDGKRLAVVGFRAIKICDVAAGQLEPESRRYRLDHQSICTGVAWAPGGQSIARVFSADHKDTDSSIECYDLVSIKTRASKLGDEEAATRSPYSVAYVSDGHVLLVGAPMRGFQALNADTLKRIPAADMSKLSHVAAGVHGELFIASQSHVVDLWDAATLRPHRRLFVAAQPPNYWLPGCGLVVWLIAFFARRNTRSRRSARVVARADCVTVPAGR